MNQGNEQVSAKERALRRVLGASHIPEPARVLVANLILDSKPAPCDAAIMGRPVQMALTVEDASIPELAARYGMTQSAVQRNLSRLEQAHFLVRYYDKSQSPPVITGTTIYLADFNALELPHGLPITKQMQTQKGRADDARAWAIIGRELADTSEKGEG